MRRLLLICLFAIAASCMRADVLSDILRGDYAPQTLSSERIDSILNGVGEGRYRLTYENRKQLFRHSFEADYYIVDTQKNTRKQLSDGPVRDPIMSPNGKYIAFTRQGRLCLYKLDFSTEIAVTSNTNNEIFEGTTDWLYEEEFGTTTIMAFSPDSKMLAFVRLDETEVPSFDWQEFLSDADESDHSSLMMYPHRVNLRYPKAGSMNASAQLCVYDIQTKAVRTIQLPEADDYYLPRIRWTNPIVEGKNVHEAELVALRLNRDQNLMEVFYCNPRSTVSKLWYREQSRDMYVDYSLFDEWQWLSDNRVLVVSEKSGWRQAYLYSPEGMERRQLTIDGVDVTAVYGMDEQTQTLYYQQADVPETRTIYALNMKKNVRVALTHDEGIHRMSFSHDWRQAIDCYESVTTPNRYTLYRVNGTQLSAPQILLDNNELAQKWASLDLPEKTWFTFTTSRGDELHGWVLTPNSQPQPQTGYPVVFTQYSGPASQRVLNRWRRTWDYYLAQQGYMVVCVDGRGTDARGRAWRNATYMNLGEKEAEDQIAAAQYVATWPNVDADRMAMVGWSYGGFQVLTTLSHNGHPFRAGIAIAPVTDWRLYDSAYTERYMRRPQVNESGYDRSSLLSRAEQLQGDLLIVHGLADDNVHAQHTLLYTDALVQAGKQFEMQIYTDDNHFLRRRANYEHLHRRLMLFLDNKLTIK